VLPIWEGSGNVIILDMLRSLLKTKGFEIICEDISNTAASSTEYGKFLKEELRHLIAFEEKLKKLQQDEMEASAKVFFEQLTSLYQISLLINNLNDDSKQWILPAIGWLKEKYAPSTLKEVNPLTRDAVKGLIAWEF
jgi:acyl-CoA dehydrogenase